MKIYIKQVKIGRLLSREAYLLWIGSGPDGEIRHRTEVLGKVRRGKPWRPDSPRPLFELDAGGYRGTLVVMDSDASSREWVERIGAAETAVRESQLLGALWASAGPTAEIIATIGGLASKALSMNKDDVLATFPLDIDLEGGVEPGEPLVLTHGSGRRQIRVDLRIGEELSNEMSASRAFNAAEAEGKGPAKTGVRTFEHRDPDEFLEAHLELALRVRRLEASTEAKTSVPIERWPLDPARWDSDHTAMIRLKDEWAEVVLGDDDTTWEFDDGQPIPDLDTWAVLLPNLEVAD